MREGRLRRDHPHQTALEPTIGANLATTPGLTTDCRGFLSEANGSVLLGLVADQNLTGTQTARRAFRYNLATGTTSTAGVEASDRDPFPGVTAILH